MKNNDKEKQEKENSPLFNFCIKTAIFAAIFSVVLYLATRVYGLHIISGTSMEPTLYSGQLVVCDFSRVPEADDVVIFTFDGKTFVKRVVGVPGEVVEIIDGELYVDGLHRNGNFEKMNTPDMTIPLDRDQYFCIGDNRNNSFDCRDFGPISLKDIRGVIKY